MADVFTIPLIVALVGLVSLLVTVLNIREQPKVKTMLLIIIGFLFMFFFWYVAPAVKLNALLRDRQKLVQNEPKTDTDTSIQEEARDIEDAQRRKEKAEREAEAYGAEQKAADARRAKDIADRAADEEERLNVKLQQDLKLDTQQRLEQSILGKFTCSSSAADLTFKPDGVLTPSFGFGETYKITDSTHVEVTSFYGHGVTFTFDMDLSSPVQTIKESFLGVTCTRVKK